MRSVKLVFAVVVMALAVSSKIAAAQEEIGGENTSCHACDGHIDGSVHYTTCSGAAHDELGKWTCLENGAAPNQCQLSGEECHGTSPDLLADGSSILRAVTRADPIGLRWAGSTRSQLIRALAAESTASLRITHIGVDGSEVARACNGNVVSRTYSVARGRALRSEVQAISF